MNTPPYPFYRIDCRNEAGAWDAGMVGEPNHFGTKEEACQALLSLRAAGYRDVDMRVVRVDELGARYVVGVEAEPDR